MRTSTSSLSLICHQFESHTEYFVSRVTWNKGIILSLMSYVVVLVLLTGSEVDDQQILDEALAILTGKSVSNVLILIL